MSDDASDRHISQDRRTLWQSLKIGVSFQSNLGGCRVVVSSIVKTSPLSGQQAPRRTPERQQRTVTAAGKNAEVQVLKQRLQSEKELLSKWEQAGEAVTDELLWRWLRSKGSIDHAEACLHAHAHWRIGLGQIKEADISSELEAKKTFLQGCDHHGRPIVVVLAARHVVKQRNLDQTKKLITYTLENAVACSDPVRNPIGQILCLFDLSGLGFSNLDTKALQAVFEVLQLHFPESLSELWFLNAPFIFWGLWKVVSPFIQPATKEKIAFLSGRKREQMLEDNIPVRVLPWCYGGKSDLIPIDMAVKHLASQLSAKKSTSVSGLTESENQGKFAALRRVGGQGAVKGWHFIKDHNPVWAARALGLGIRRVSLALPRPGWHRGQPALSRHASAVSQHVRKAWNNRPAMPRPHYRLKQPSTQQPSMTQYVDVATFYILAAILVMLFVSYLKGAVGWQGPWLEITRPLGYSTLQ